MASLTDILAAIQNGVVALNNLASQVSTTFTNIIAYIGLTRPRLTQAATYYIATNGNDANDGLTPATAWGGNASDYFAHAIAHLTGQIDFGGQTVTLQAVAGHASFTTQLKITPWTGGGSFIYDGGAGSISTTSADAIQINGDIPGTFAYQNVSLGTTTSGFCVRHIGVGTVQQLAGVTFNAAASSHLFVGGGGGALIELQNSYAINGGAGSHIVCGNGQITSDLAPSGVTATLTGNPQFPGDFVFVNAGQLFIRGITFSGTATGYQSGNVIATGVLDRGGTANVVGGVNLPGNGLVTTGSGGQLT